MGQSYVNYGSKLILMREELTKIKCSISNPIVMFTDAFDVLIFDKPSSIIESFKRFEANIVFGAEYALMPDKSILEKYPEGPPGSEFDKLIEIFHGPGLSVPAKIQSHSPVLQRLRF